MLIFKSRREREARIVAYMIRFYCVSLHDSKKILCADCRGLTAYLHKRLLTCKFGDTKPACKECTVHCYSPAMRAKMRDVMRWAGSRMLFKHPFYAILYLIDTKFSSKTHKLLMGN